MGLYYMVWVEIYLLSGSIYYQFTELAYAIVGFGFVLCLFLGVTRHPLKLRKSRQQIIMMLSFLFIVLVLLIDLLTLNNAKYGDYINAFYAVGFSMFVISVADTNRLIAALSNITLLLSVASILSFIVSIVFFTEIQSLPSLHSRFTQEAWCLPGVCFQQSANIFGLSFYRSQLFFWEPAILGGFIVLGASLKGNTSTRRSSIYLSGALCTFSTAAYIALCIFVMRKFIASKHKLFIRSLILLSLPIVAWLLYLNITEKLSFFHENQQIMETSSFFIRYQDLLAGWKAFLLHPFFGNGLNASPYTTIHMFYRYGLGISNGILTLFSSFGILGLIWFASFLFNWRAFFTLPAVFFIIQYFNEPLALTASFYIFIFIITKKGTPRGSGIATEAYASFSNSIDGQKRFAHSADLSPSAMAPR